MSALIDIAIRESGRQSSMTFEELVKGCTADEREQLAWHLAMLRARRTFEALAKAPGLRMRREAGLTQSDRHVSSDTPNIIPPTTVKGETL